MPDGSGNVYAGGIQFSPLVGANAGSLFDPTGGLHFDLPMAALQTIQNNALAFTAVTASADQGFLARVLGTNAALVGSATQQSTMANQSAISASYGVGIANVNLAAQISNNTLNASKYAIQQQSYQVQTQTKQSTWQKLIGGVFGGIFG